MQGSGTARSRDCVRATSHLDRHRFPRGLWDVLVHVELHVLDQHVVRVVCDHGLSSERHDKYSFRRVGRRQAHPPRSRQRRDDARESLRTGSASRGSASGGVTTLTSSRTQLEHILPTQVFSLVLKKVIGEDAGCIPEMLTCSRGASQMPRPKGSL